MAAGMGSRYGGLKQIDPVGPSDEIVLDYSIFDARRAGFDRLVFVIRKDIEEAFREAVGKKYEDQMDVHYAFQDLYDVPEDFRVPEERSKPWGTAHAVLAARDILTRPFAALNADDFYGAESFEVLARFLEQAKDKDGLADYSMVGFELEKTLSKFGSVARGLCSRNEQGNLDSVVEYTAIQEEGDQIVQTMPDGKKIQLQPDDLVSMNMWGFTPSFLDLAWEHFGSFLKNKGSEAKSEFYIPSVVDQLIQENRATCKVLPTRSQWFGVTYQEDKPYVQNRLADLAKDGHYPTPLWTHVP